MIKFYYVLYTTYKGANEIRLREFDSKEEALKFKEECDAKFKERGQYRFSKVMKRDMSKHSTEYWL